MGTTLTTKCFDNRLTAIMINANLATEMEESVSQLLRRLCCEDEGQDIAEYAVMLAVILVIVVGTIRLIGTQSNAVFSNVASALQ